MKITRTLKKILYPLALLSLFSTPLLADSENFATLQGSGNVVFWSIGPNVQFDSIKLTLSSGAEVIEKISDTEPSTDPLADGSYQYELVVTPPVSTKLRSQLRAARRAAKGQEGAETVRSLHGQGALSQQRLAQSGAFTILGGQLVPADLTE